MTIYLIIQFFLKIYTHLVPFLKIYFNSDFRGFLKENFLKRLMIMFNTFFTKYNYFFSYQ